MIMGIGVGIVIAFISYIIIQIIKVILQLVYGKWWS